MSPTRVAVCILLAATGACASSRGKTPSTTASDVVLEDVPRPSTHRASNVIMRDELVDPTIASLSTYDAVRTLRPLFLTRRGAISLRDPNAGIVRASIDGGRIVPIEDLNYLHASEVREIRFLSASEATQRFGVAAGGSPVLVVQRM